MKYNEHILKFPSDSGFDRTTINFYSGTPDLAKMFFEEQTSSVPRLFITDTSIASLETVKPFADSFEDETPVSKEILRAGKRGTDYLCVLGPGEPYKTIQSVLAMVQMALEKNFGRNAEFVSIGGGVISDLAGFAASIFKRGIKCRFVPTTVLAMVDASVGGKTGCDFYGYKNMIGAFHPAETIDIFPYFIQSLSEREFRSGLGEAVKTAFLFNNEMTDLLEKESEKINRRDEAALEKIIEGCVKAKAMIVEKDLREQNERALLNYGHTFGHALETCAGLGKVTHGEAVAWGMGRALALSEKLGKADRTFLERARKILKMYGYSLEPVAQDLIHFESEEEAEDFSEKLIHAMRKDKKNMDSSGIRVVYQNNFCDNVIAKVDEKTIAEVLK